MNVPSLLFAPVATERRGHRVILGQDIWTTQAIGSAPYERTGERFTHAVRARAPSVHRAGELVVHTRDLGVSHRC